MGVVFSSTETSVFPSAAGVSLTTASTSFLDSGVTLAEGSGDGLGSFLGSDKAAEALVAIGVVSGTGKVRLFNCNRGRSPVLGDGAVIPLSRALLPPRQLSPRDAPASLLPPSA
jgi:hypothetical protein